MWKPCQDSFRGNGVAEFRHSVEHRSAPVVLSAQFHVLLGKEKESLSLRASDPDSDEKYQGSADNHLKGGTEKWRVHVAISNPTDEQKLNGYD